LAAKGLLDAALDSAASQSKRIARAKEQDFNIDLPLYHGTSKSFKGFKKSNLGSLTGSRSAKRAFWMSDDPVTAGSYAHHSAIKGPVQDLIRKAEEAEQKGNFDKYDTLLDEAEKLEKVLEGERLAGQNIIPVYAKNDLLEIDMEGRSFSEFGDVSDKIELALDKAKQDGRAGVKLLNLNDAVGLSDAPSTHVAVFEPNNIRSVSAKFDPRRKSSTNLLASPAPVTIGAGLLGNAAVQRFNEGVLGGADFLANAGSAVAEPFITAAQTLRALPTNTPTSEIEAQRAAYQNSLDYQPRTEIGRNATESALGLLGGALQGPMAAGKAIAEPLIPIYDAAAEQYKRLPRRVQLGAESLLDLF